MNKSSGGDKHFHKQGFEITRNVRGFMHQLNEISVEFIDFAHQAPGMVVDMGSAFGIATIPILKQGIEVTACDIEQEHLNELILRVPAECRLFLQTKAGSFPEDYNFEKHTIGAILLSHILHFLTPEKLDMALDKLSDWVAPQGKIFIVSYTPYIAPMKDFIPLYEERALSGMKWPYWIVNNIHDYFTGSKEVAENLPDTMNYLDLPSLSKALQSRGFIIEMARYLDPDKNQIPQGVRFDGREWCGVIARQPD
jgi:hypothetical protein